MPQKNVTQKCITGRSKKDEITLSDARIGSDFFNMMMLSGNAPHVRDSYLDRMARDALFPFCSYDGQPQGVEIEGYSQKLCTDFQPTFNDYGLCYTFNNFRQGMRFRFGQTSLAPNLELRKVAGCGKESGFQLVIDSHNTMKFRSDDMGGKGYLVFVTLPGVVSSKLPYFVDPSFQGEHDFYIHGIHTIEASHNFKVDEFR